MKGIPSLLIFFSYMLLPQSYPSFKDLSRESKIEMGSQCSTLRGYKKWSTNSMEDSCLIVSD